MSGLPWSAASAAPAPTSGGPRRDWRAVWNDEATRLRTVDAVAAALAASLPWSTSATGILVVVWLIVLLPTIEPRVLLRSLARPAAALPLALVALAVVGTLWADSAFAARLHGINPVAKFAAIPLLLYHFERSRHALWVLVAFVASCALLMALSWLVLFVPQLKPAATVDAGVPVKNYIDQSQEFTLCLFVLAAPALGWLRARRYPAAALCLALMAGFFANMMFVVSARTALVSMPLLLVLFAALHLSRRAMAGLFAAAIIAGFVVWSTSPYLRARLTHIAVEYQGYEHNEVTSTAQRLEYWTKSLKFIRAAPLVGNGTGATKELFERDAVGQTGLRAEVIGNPHNQTLNVAVQWGLVGCVLLYAMWLSHGLMFRGLATATSLAGWTGLLVVVQNVISSLFNSHLFDFHEGWMYVLGVGVAGGMVRRQRRIAEGEAVMNGRSPFKDGADDPQS